MTAKRMTCPHCHETLELGVNCHHSDDLSLTCGKCSKVVFPVTQAQEDTIPKYASKQSIPARVNYSVSEMGECDCD